MLQQIYCLFVRKKSCLRRQNESQCIPFSFWDTWNYPLQGLKLSECMNSCWIVLPLWDFEVLTVVLLKIQVFWHMTFSPNNTASYPRRHEFSVFPFLCFFVYLVKISCIWRASYISFQYSHFGNKFYQQDSKNSFINLLIKNNW